VIALMAGMAVAAYARLARINEESHTVQSESIPGLYASMALQDAWSDGLFLTERYVAQSDAAERRKTEARIQSSRAELDRLAPADEAAAADKSRQPFEAFKSARAAYTRVEDRLLEADGSAGGTRDLNAIVQAQLLPDFERGASAIKAVVAMSKADADASG